ncbi:MAG: tetratricopeptide repeat protein [Planctomycetota bacterium]|jgi:tetratricopeptide (TPR) repeat protein|nr:tetratricopeptide repeat protein [Planctomycetota bacterium]
MPSRILILANFLLFAVGCVGCGSTTTVFVPYQKASLRQIPSNLKKVAVVDFNYKSRNPKWSATGSQLSGKIRSHLSDSPRWQVVERRHIEHAQAEELFSGSNLMGRGQAIEQVGQQVGADAIIVGEINNVLVADESFTRKQIIRDPERPLDSDRYQTREVRELRRKGSVTVTVKMFDVKNKVDIVTHHGTGSYDSEKKLGGGSRLLADSADSFLGTSMAESRQSQIPDPNTIIDELLEKIAKDFILKVSPHVVRVPVPLLHGEHPAIETGILYASRGDWTAAEDSFRMALGQSSFEDQAAVHYNLAVTLEAQSRYQDALDQFKKALTISPEELFMDGKMRVQRHMREQSRR